MEKPSQQVYVLRLYNADRSAEMLAMADRIKDAVVSASAGECRVEVVDVLADPERAAQEGVFLTPTLVRELPEPVRRVIGDLSEPGKTLALLGVLAEDVAPQPRK